MTIDINAEARSAEARRLEEDARREKNWKRWGSYLSERQWGTVREDYSEWGTCWDHFPHDHARSRAYRWGEDGLLGIADRQCRLCFALALWNGRDPILKERLFGLGGPEGNHGEDVKEAYYYLDATPTHSYMKALYKYPQAEYPYTWLVEENRRRGRSLPEFEIEETGVFEDGRYFDVFAEYAKASPEDILVRITVANRSGEKASLHVLPTLWFRNTWSWGAEDEGSDGKPRMWREAPGAVLADHGTLGRYLLRAWEGTGGAAPGGPPPPAIFTENETNTERVFGWKGRDPYVKDSFHEYLIRGATGAVNPEGRGTKAAFVHLLEIPAHGERTMKLRLTAEREAAAGPFDEEFDLVFERRIAEADAWHQSLEAPGLTPAERTVSRQAAAGLLWSKQFYHYVIKDWLEGDREQPPPPAVRRRGRNHDWKHIYNRDVVSMPDKWEYPWYAAWDLAFHMIPFARIDPRFAKDQLVLFLREWYMHPNGQIPAYEFAFSDVNPPVHAWAAWRVYKMTGVRGTRDRAFLNRVFQKLLLNFTWWVNRKDVEGHNIFSGGFLGLDNIGVFDRSQPLPTGGHLEQADGTAWMAFYCATMLSMALELARVDPAAEDMASKFLEHFVAIADAINSFGGTGLWDEQDGFYYDRLHVDGSHHPLRIRSLVGVIPLFAVEVLEDDVIAKLPGFRKRLDWFLKHRQDLAQHITCFTKGEGDSAGRRLLAIPTKPRLLSVLRYVLDEDEFLSPHGIRSLSKHHERVPYSIVVDGREYRVDYTPGESNTPFFGGNSNWRGPIWFPLNFLLAEALERYHHYYGDGLQVECPVGSGRMMNLKEVAAEIASRLVRIFLPDEEGRRPCHGSDLRYANDPHFRDLVLFYEYFHGDTGRGVGASHQTGWTAIVHRLINDLARAKHDGRSW